MKYLIIYNPVSGSRVLRNKAHERVALSLLAAGHEVRMLTTQYAGHAAKEAHAALSTDVDVICAVGGDGTINEVASALVGSSKLLGIIPNGSGNGLARELNIPLPVDQAIDTLLRHSVSEIDTCTVNGHPFFCTCGIGFDGSVSEEFSESSLRGPMVYVKDVVRVFFSQTPSSYEINIDGEHLSTKAFLIAFANAPQYGNNAYIAPNASLTDGIIDITIIRDFPTVDALQVALQLFSKGLGSSPYAQLYRGRHISLKALSPTPYHADGEPMGSAQEVEIEVHPSSLRVITGDMQSKTTRNTAEFFQGITNRYINFHNDLMNKLGVRDFDSLSDPEK